jgi:hypothetical protein
MIELLPEIDKNLFICGFLGIQTHIVASTPLLKILNRLESQGKFDEFLSSYRALTDQTTRFSSKEEFEQFLAVLRRMKDRFREHAHPVTTWDDKGVDVDVILSIIDDASLFENPADADLVRSSVADLGVIRVKENDENYLQWH